MVSQSTRLGQTKRLGNIHTKVRLSKKPSIAIIGAGTFGSFFAKQLQRHTHVVVHDAFCSRVPGLTCVDLNTALQQDWIILAVPVNAVKPLLNRIGPRLKPTQTILDVCSLKVPVCQAFHTSIPPTVRAVGMHPLFGPNFTQSLVGQKLVLCPCSTKAISDIRSFFSRCGLTCLVCSAQEHDTYMAQTQTISHILGSVILEYDKTRSVKKISTASYNALLEFAKKVCAESPYLHSLIQKNPFAKRAKKTFVRIVQQKFRVRK
jgi:prephenate dehydrogenase